MKRIETPVEKYEQALAKYLGGEEVPAICKEIGISQPLFYKWSRLHKWIDLRQKMRTVADDLIIKHKVKSILHKEGRINDMIDKLLSKGMREIDDLEAKDCFDLAIKLDKVRRLNVGSPTEIVDLNLNKFIEAENKVRQKKIEIREYKVSDNDKTDTGSLENEFDEEPPEL
jgi:hypothetical protein